MIYLDYNATTPCDPEVLQSMLPYFSEKFGNAGSKSHAFGWIADEAAEQARKQIADCIHATSHEIIFTSGATESCNLAIKGVIETYGRKGNHIITAVTEHHAVLDTCKALEHKGASLTYLPVNESGLINLGELEAAIRPETVLIALMYANNETGVLQPVAEIGKIAKKSGVLFFTDATQALGKIPVNVLADDIDLMAMSAHKIYGPKGIGALYVRRRAPRVSLAAQIDGGGQERGLRSGTLNVPGIVGFGRACMLMQEKMESESALIKAMRDDLERVLLAEKNSFINGAGAERLPNVINIAFEGIRAERLLKALNHQFAFSLGSACTSAVQGPSHVLQEMGLNVARLKGSVRISLGRFTTREELDEVMCEFPAAVKRLKADHFQTL